MAELASPAQLRGAFLRWALVLAPGILLLGYVSAAIAASGPGNLWFDSLVKPALYPEPIIFRIVWTLLYLLMGLALAMILAARGARGRGAAVVIFAVQLVLNLAWSPLFFAAHRIAAALVLLVVLDVAVLVTILLFWRVRPVAAGLLAPYLAWILFATLLNYQFLVANPGADGQAVPGAVTRVEL